MSDASHDAASGLPPGRAGVVAAVALLGGVLAGLRPVAGLDIWWHLRTGERLWHQAGWLSVERLSDGAAGRPWPYKDIASDVLLYLAYAAGGDAVLSWLPALVAALLAASLWVGTPRRAGGTAVWAALAIAALASMLHRLHARPMLFSLLAFAALLPLCERGRRDARWQAQVPVLLLLLVWGWLHRGVLLGVGVAAASAAAVTASTPLPGRLLRGVVVLVLGGLAAVANPNGLATLATATALVGGEAFRAHVSEWQAMPLDVWLRHHGTLLVPVVVASAAVVAGVRRGGWQALGDPFALVLALGTLALAASSARYLPYAALASARVALLLLPATLPARMSGAFAALTLALLGFLAWERPASPLRPDGGFVGLQVDRYPGDALAYARREALPAEVENAYDFGGYLLWFADGWLRPSVDGRADMVYAPDAFDLALRAEHDPEAFARQQALHDRSWVLARQEPGGRTHGFLARDPGWALVFWSEPAAIFVRCDRHAALCERDGLRLFRGVALDAQAFAHGRDPSRREPARAELERMRAMAPGSVRVRVAEVVLHHAAGERARRDALLEVLVREHGESMAVRALLERLSRAASAPAE